MKLQNLTPYVFAFTLFLSASLVFFVQPMVGKMMLPYVGGSPAGWAVTMFFFQTCLLCGYGLAYLFSKLPPLPNVIAIALVFIAGAFFLPISYYNNLEGGISPIAVFVQLTLTAAVPFLALSTIAPALQRLFTFSGHATAGDPYYLYAASNIGSFTGLLAYPVIFEPLIGLSAQSNLWMILFGILFLCLFLCAGLIIRNNPKLFSLKFTAHEKSDLVVEREESPVTWQRRFMWVIMAAIPSSLMIGVTTEITTDIASAPMLWVLPLSLYLLTNILAFSKRHLIDINKYSFLHILGVIFIMTHNIAGFTTKDSTFSALAICLAYMAIFYITAMMLHSRIANDRPSTSRLTEFYLMLSLGGALGGSLNAFVAPYLFNDMYEFHGVLILSLLLNPTFYQKFPEKISGILNILIGGMLVASFLAVFTDIDTKVLYGLMAVCVLFASIHTKYLFLAVTILFLTLAINNKDNIHIARNFFGVIKIHEGTVTGGEEKDVRILMHGTTLHGFQPIGENYRNKSFGYYGAASPVGDIFEVADPSNIAVLGLGVGLLACHTKEGRDFTFYEIDQNVIDAAKQYFTALKDCGYKDIVLGDGRLALAASDEKYDAILMDAFSSDSIPAHLMTEEAIEMYFSKLKEDAPIVVHISNRHLDLRKPLAAIAKDKGYYFREKIYERTKENPYEYSSHWTVITKDENFARKLDKKGWKTTETSIRPWTDDYSNLLVTFKFLDIFKPQPPEEKTEK